MYSPTLTLRPGSQPVVDAELVSGAPGAATCRLFSISERTRRAAADLVRWRLDDDAAACAQQTPGTCASPPKPRLNESDGVGDSHRPKGDTSVQGPVLESRRVRIEPINHERGLALLAGHPEPGSAWAHGFPPPPLLASLQRVLDDGVGPGSFGPFYAYVIIRRSDGLTVGDAGFFGPPSNDGEVEIGYALVPSARGSGLASDAVALLVKWALGQSGVRALTARVEADNAASLRLLGRLGFVADGRSDPYLRFVLRSEGGD